jgi:hypothetical protein
VTPTCVAPKQEDLPSSSLCSGKRGIKNAAAVLLSDQQLPRPPRHKVERRPWLLQWAPPLLRVLPAFAAGGAAVNNVQLVAR